ncbi:zinc-binding alcohol dehydrogenase [soil metagenome]
MIPVSAPGRPRPVVVRFTAPRTVDVHEYEPESLAPGHVRVRTLYSGISAGTELTAFRGSNVYLNKRWDDQRRLFTHGTRTFSYPVTGWGYSEVGEVVEIASDIASDVDADHVVPGDRVYGVWGHRSEAVLTAATLAGRRLPDHVDPLVGVFGRVGAIALNAVASAELHLGENVAVFGQGVLGLLTTRLATLSGTKVVAVDALAARLALAETFGARHLVDAARGEVAEAVKLHATAAGVDVAIEISGSYRALHEAVRSVAVGGRVVAAGFYQGEGVGLHLGEEFHLNRVQIIASQIGGLPSGLAGRWDVERLHQVFMALVEDGEIDVRPLVSHVLPVRDVASAYALLDERPEDALQVVLDFRDPSAPA